MMPNVHRESLDTSQIASIYEAYSPLLLNIIRRYVPGASDAEDILVDVFLSLMENQRLLNFDQASIFSWLRRVAYNKCMDFHRRRSRRSFIPIDDLEEETLLISAQHEEPEQQLLSQEEYEQLRIYIAELPEQQQRVLQYHFVHGLKGVEIAHKLQAKEGSVRSWLSRALKGLRAIYQKNQSQEDGDSR
jgi:RNA polymerase sigma-70 factor (ECF subfamily)